MELTVWSAGKPASLPADSLSQASCDVFMTKRMGIVQRPKKQAWHFYGGRKWEAAPDLRVVRDVTFCSALTGMKVRKLKDC